MPSYVGIAYDASGITPVTGSFAAISQSASFQPIAGRPFNIALTGAGTATVQLEATYDNGTTWCIIDSGLGTQMYVWNYAGVALTARYEEVETGVKYRLNCTAWTSALNYRISQ